MESTRLGRAQLVDWLLDHGAAPAFLSGVPKVGGAALHCALRRHYWLIAAKLSEAMERTDMVDAYGCTPLHLLAMESNADEGSMLTLTLAKLLISKRCPLDALDHEGITALHYCVINNHLSLAELLLEYGAKCDVQIPDSWVSPLTIAALDQNTSMAQLLMRFGANAHHATREGVTPVSIMPGLGQIAS
jgi:ankyrin repeat protein